MISIMHCPIVLRAGKQNKKFFMWPDNNILISSYLLTWNYQHIHRICIFQQSLNIKFTSYFDSVSAQSLSLFGL